MNQFHHLDSGFICGFNPPEKSTKVGDHPQATLAHADRHTTCVWGKNYDPQMVTHWVWLYSRASQSSPANRRFPEASDLIFVTGILHERHIDTPCSLAK